MSGTASRNAPLEEGRAPQQRPSSLLLARLSGHAGFCTGKLSETLQQAEVKLVDTTSCNLAAYHGEVTEKMLCAGLPQGGVDTCQVRGGTAPSIPPAQSTCGGPDPQRRGWFLHIY